MKVRNVQLVGKYTFTLSLPKDWVQKWSLKKGDKILIMEEEDGSLRVAPETKVEGRPLATYKINVDKCEQPRMLERLLVGNYILGRETIELTSEGETMKPEHVLEVRKALRKLTGLSIVEEAQNRIVLQCFIEPVKFPIERLVKRLHALTSMMHSDSVEAVINANKELALSVIQREAEADMIYWLMLRQLVIAAEDRSAAKDIGIRDVKHQQGLRVVAKSLESIADQSEEIAKICLNIMDASLKIDESVSKLIREFSNAVSAIHNKALEAYLKRDPQLANEALNESEEIGKYEAKINEVAISSVKDARLLMAIYKVAGALKNINMCATDLAKIAINRYLAEAE
ncbi:MAG: phosphate uptake regulator PhoU [Candidatus Nezhaarchaeota archaeon]|nr:phosphate uptake regulator PhoU [Candidatus Nezhaarchaeota archaeon]